MRVSQNYGQKGGVNLTDQRGRTPKIKDWLTVSRNWGSTTPYWAGGGDLPEFGKIVDALYAEICTWAALGLRSLARLSSSEQPLQHRDQIAYFNSVVLDLFDRSTLFGHFEIWNYPQMKGCFSSLLNKAQIQITLPKMVVYPRRVNYPSSGTTVLTECSSCH